MRTNLKIITMALVMLFAASVLAPAVHADTTDTDTTTVSVEVSEIIDIKAVNPGSGGTLATTSPTVNVTFTVTGSGLVTITDPQGHVLYSYTKTTTAPETITTPITIIGGAGDYKLTMSITNDNLGTVSDFIVIAYRPVGIPDTGTIKIGNQEYSVASVSILGAVMVALAIIAIIFKKHDRKQQQALTAKVKTTK